MNAIYRNTVLFSHRIGQCLVLLVLNGLCSFVVETKLLLKFVHSAMSLRLKQTV